jgi:hypothetical protein
MTRLRWLLALAAALIVAPTSVVFAAATAPGEPVALNTDADTSLNLSPIIVVLISSVLIPLINGLVTKLSDSSKVKSVVTLFLSGVAGLVTVGITEGGGAIISQEALIAAAVTFVVSVALYFGVYKPFELTSSPILKVDAAGNQVVVPGKLAGIGRK